jgi:hypothetical protein
VKKDLGSKPDSGNPTVRDCREAPGNVAEVKGARAWILSRQICTPGYVRGVSGIRCVYRDELTENIREVLPP